MYVSEPCERLRCDNENTRKCTCKHQKLRGHKQCQSANGIRFRLIYTTEARAARRQHQDRITRSLAASPGHPYMYARSRRANDFSGIQCSSAGKSFMSSPLKTNRARNGHIDPSLGGREIANPATTRMESMLTSVHPCAGEYRFGRRSWRGSSTSSSKGPALKAVFNPRVQRHIEAETTKALK